MSQQTATEEVGIKIPPGSVGQQPQFGSQQPAQPQQYGYNNNMAGGPIGQPQPGGMQQIQWMPPPQVMVPGCPRGLEYLTQIDQLLIHQVIELFEGKMC